MRSALFIDPWKRSVAALVERGAHALFFPHGSLPELTNAVRRILSDDALRARLSSYFQDVAHLHPRTATMVTSAASVDWTVAMALPA